MLEDLHSIFLVDERGRLRGSVPLAKLFFTSGDTALPELAADPLLFISDDESQERVAEMFDKYNLLTLPVVDSANVLVGVVTVDDVVALLRQS